MPNTAASSSDKSELIGKKSNEYEWLKRVGLSNEQLGQLNIHELEFLLNKWEKLWSLVKEYDESLDEILKLNVKLREKIIIAHRLFQKDWLPERKKFTIADLMQFEPSFVEFVLNNYKNIAHIFPFFRQEFLMGLSRLEEGFQHDLISRPDFNFILSELDMKLRLRPPGYDKIPTGFLKKIITMVYKPNKLLYLGAYINGKVATIEELSQLSSDELKEAIGNANSIVRILKKKKYTLEQFFQIPILYRNAIYKNSESKSMDSPAKISGYSVTQISAFKPRNTQVDRESRACSSSSSSSSSDNSKFKKQLNNLINQ